MNESPVKKEVESNFDSANITGNAEAFSLPCFNILIIFAIITDNVANIFFTAGDSEIVITAGLTQLRSDRSFTDGLGTLGNLPPKVRGPGLPRAKRGRFRTYSMESPWWAPCKYPVGLV